MEHSTHTWCRAAYHTHNNNKLPPRKFIGEIRYCVLLFASLRQCTYWHKYYRQQSQELLRIRYFKISCHVILTLSWPAGHIYLTYRQSFQACWDNSIPFFLHAAIYFEVSLFLWTSQNAFSFETAVYKWYSVQCCYAALDTVSFAHGRFAGKCILTGSKE